MRDSIYFKLFRFIFCFLFLFLLFNYVEIIFRFFNASRRLLTYWYFWRAILIIFFLYFLNNYYFLLEDWGEKFSLLGLVDFDLVFIFRNLGCLRYLHIVIEVSVHHAHSVDWLNGFCAVHIYRDLHRILSQLILAITGAIPASLLLFLSFSLKLRLIHAFRPLGRRALLLLILPILRSIRTLTQWFRVALWNHGVLFRSNPLEFQVLFLSLLFLLF